MAGFTTIEGRAQAEIEAKKSRFIGQIAHAGTEEEALAFLDEVRGKHRMARHNVYAYIVHADGASDRMRYSDDGEPQKTAGMPTLDTLLHAGLVDVCLVTTRYFGGMLLGTGGLVHAYTQAAQAAIDAARLVRISPCVDIETNVPYALYESLARIAEGKGARIVATSFTDDVAVRIRTLAGAEEPLVKKIEELTRGTAHMRISGPHFAPF